MLSTVLVVLLILLLVGALPTWGYSSGWGYGPGGIVGVLLIVVVVLALTGRILVRQANHEDAMSRPEPQRGCRRFMI